MKIEFELIDKKHVKIIGVDKKKRQDIGEIFTPSGSGEMYTNAIQICGFTEAFDLWGCANYQTYKLDEGGNEYVKKKVKYYEFPFEIFEAFEPEVKNKLVKLFRKANMRLDKDSQTKDGRIKIQLKDIQLKFPHISESFEDKKHIGLRSNNCWGCFNIPCTCENKGKHRNPYDTKRSSDLYLEEVKDEKPKSKTKKSV